MQSPETSWVPWFKVTAPLKGTFLPLFSLVEFWYLLPPLIPPVPRAEGSSPALALTLVLPVPL